MFCKCLRSLLVGIHMNFEIMIVLVAGSKIVVEQVQEISFVKIMRSFGQDFAWSIAISGNRRAVQGLMCKLSIVFYAWACCLYTSSIGVSPSPCRTHMPDGRASVVCDYWLWLLRCHWTKNLFYNSVLAVPLANMVFSVLNISLI
jgi:hypothetical protein